METNLPNEMHFVRQTMLQHDAIFKEQVRELHRVYKVQVLLMDELNKRGTDPPACSSTSGGGCSLQPTSAPTTEFSTRQDLYIGGRSPSPGSFSCENNGIDKKEREESFAIKQVPPQPKLPARRRSFDLERPAEEYMDDDLGQEEEDRKEVLAPSTFHLVTSCNASLEPREKDKIEQGPNQQNQEIQLNHLTLFKKPTEETPQFPYDSSKLALRPTPSNQTFLGGIWGLSSEKCMDKTMASQMGINSNDINASRKSPKVSFELDMSDPPDYKAMKIDGNSRIQYYSPHDVGEEKSQANQRTAKVSTPDDRWDNTFFDRPGNKAQQVLLSKSGIAAAYETQKPMQRCNETLPEGMQGTNSFFNSISQGQAASFVTLPGLGMQPRVSNGLSSLPMQGMVLPSVNVGRNSLPDTWWKTQGNYSQLQLQQLQSQYQQFSMLQPGNVQVTWQTPNHVTTGGAYHTGAVFTLPSGAASMGYMDMGGARVRDEWGRGNGGPHFSSFSSPTPPKPPFKKPPKLVLDGNTMELKLAAAEREAQATKSTQKFSSRILGEEQSQSRLEQTMLQSRPQDIFLSLQPGQMEAGEAMKEANMFPLNEKSLHAENTGGIRKMVPVENNMGDALMKSNSIRLVGNSSDLCFTQRTEVPQEHEISCNIPGGQIVQEERKVFQAAATENNDQIRQNATLDEDVDFEDKEICREVKIDHDKTCQDGNIADFNGNHSSVRQRHNDHDVINPYASEPTCATETRDRNGITHPDEDCGCQCGGRFPCQCVLDGKSKIKATAEVHIQNKMQKRESNEMQLEASLGKKVSGPIDHASTGSGLAAQKDIMLATQIEVESNAYDDSACISKSISKSGIGVDGLMPSLDHMGKSEEKKVSKRSRADASPLKGSADKDKASRTNLEVNGVANRCKIDGKSATTNGGGPKVSPSKTSFSCSSKKADMPDDSSLDTDESANLAAAILVSLAPKTNSQSRENSMPAARSLRMISKSMFSKDDGSGKGSGASIEAHGDMELRSLSRGKLLVAVQTETLIRPTKESVKFTVTLKRDVDKARDHEHGASDHKKLLTKRKHSGLASRKKKSRCDQADKSTVLSLANEDMKSMARASKLVPQNANVSDQSAASEWEATDQATSQGSKSGEDAEKPLKNLTSLSCQKQFTLQDEIPAIKWGDTTRKRRMHRAKKQPCQPALKQQKLLSLKSSR